MVESCWATPHKDGFQLDNIPFYVKKYAYGDIVSAKLTDGMYEVNGLIKPSGNSTIRIYVFEENDIDKVNEAVKNLGCDSEINRKDQLIAVDIPSTLSYEKIESYVKREYENDVLDYEEASISEIHQG